MQSLLGSNMPADAQREALASFVHRFTRTHVPAWARQPRPDGRPYPVQFASDGDWLAHTEFQVTKAGKLASRGSCYSRPTWPDNPELRGLPGSAATETAA